MNRTIPFSYLPQFCCDIPRQYVSLLFFAATILFGTCLPANNVAAQSIPNQYGHLNNWQTGLKLEPTTGFATVWRKSVGEGRSQIVVDGDRIFIHVGENEKRKGKADLIRSRLLCLERETGKEIWKHVSETAEMLKGQETFSGAPISPRSTPVVVDNAIISISYTGIVECLETESGKVRWSLNLVDDLGADPVQFGFSASPVVKDVASQQVFVAAAGEEAGLFCLDTKDGSTIWKAVSPSFSYATPSFARFEGTEQIISITRNEVLGIDATNGTTLWQHPLTEKGLTNVPSPLVLDDGFLISGQGIKGTRRINVSNVDGNWKTSERWFARNAQFFYSNWSRFGDVVLGCESRVMLALNIEDGSVLGKWRGFTDGNLIRAGDVTLVFDGKGTLNLLTDDFASDNRGFNHHSKVKVLDRRCWTPPTLFRGGMLLRGGEQLVMLKFCENGAGALPNLIKEPKRLKLKSIPKESKTMASTVESVDHVENIFATFQSNGVDAALKMYNKLRTQKPSQLQADDRIKLYETAKANGLDDIADMILVHAVEDFPSSKEIQNISKQKKK